MWLVAIAWMYVAVMMAVVEAFSPQGSVLGAVFTLLLYGIAPIALVMYLLNTPARRRARRAAEAAELEALRQTPQPEEAAAAASPAPALSEAPASSGVDPDAGGLTARDAVSPERKEV